ncbi:MAG: hypothetical protein ABR616_18145 [Dermatophilaceae bacterium]|nr:hypothetical protein [Intrasporangiaceae bacterium]
MYFTFFATPDQGGVVSAFDWFVAIWALLAALGLLATSLAPFPARSRRLQAAWWVMGVHLAWALMKLLTYDEMPVSAIVVPIDLVILTLLWRAGRARA